MKRRLLLTLLSLVLSYAASFAISPITGPSTVCAGSTISLTDATVGGIWISSNPTVATVTGSGTSATVTGMAAGTSIISYMMTGGGDVATKIVSVSPSPAPIAGPSAMCLSSGPVTYTCSPGGGSWVSSNPAVVTISPAGVATPISIGTATISYTMITGCSRTITVSVISSPSVSGPGVVAVGGTITLTGTPPGGTWSCIGCVYATVSSGGVVTGLAGGLQTIFYAFGPMDSSSCWASLEVEVDSTGGPGDTTTTGPPITGPSIICAGMTATYHVSDSVEGTWSSAHPSVATVGSASGVVTAMSAGTTVISFVMTGGAVSTMVVTVLAAPAAITGPTTVCAGSFITLSDVTPGGSWSSSNVSVATVTGSGSVHGLSPGTAIITYTLSTGCYVTFVVTVTSATSAISGPSSLCAGTSITLSSTPSGGTWSSSNPTVAFVGATSGVVTGVVAGSTTITYSTGGCFTTKVITVMSGGTITGPSTACIGMPTTYISDSAGTWSVSTPAVGAIGATSGIFTGITTGSEIITFTHAGCISTKSIAVSTGPSAITGGTTVCAGSTLTLADATPGGTWSTSNPSVATVNLTTGVVTGIAPGTATIFYTIGSGCSVSTVITVGSGPSAISGPSSVCVSSTITLSSTPPGGAWISGNILIASVTSAGVVTGNSAGSVTITYQVGGCKVFKAITVNSAPAAIVGPTSVCMGNTITLTDPTPGGTWSSADPSIASINMTSGVVTGNAAGTTNISYTTPCGTKILTITVNPNGAISGPSSMCAGTTVTEAATPGGGTWSTSSSIVSIGMATGIVTAIAPGTAAISYTIPSGCSAVKIITVNALPLPITGPTTVAVGGSIALSDASAGGMWTSSAPVIATVDAVGTVTGITTGVVTISYTLPTGCSVSYIVTVTPSSATPPITGPLAICQGANVTYTETVSGTWSSSNGLVAIIGVSSGILTPLLPGTSTVTFVPTTGSPVSIVITVNPIPSGLSGMNVCVGGSTTFTCSTPGGTWVSGNTSVATIGATTGLVTGISAGATFMSYVLPTGCASAIPVTVNPAPAITGTLTICAGGSTTFSSTPAGGTWLSTDVSVATVGITSGIVTGAAFGTAIIEYFAPTGCWASVTVTVSPGPAPIAGPSSVCVGNSITLFDATPGGAWTTSSSAIASVNTGTGVVTGISAGVAVITYSLGTGCFVTTTVTVGTSATPITGPSVLCLGSGALYTAGTGGTWSSSNTAIATIGSASGSLFAISAGVVTISYNSGGCIATKSVTVTPAPAPIVGPSIVCVGSSIMLTNSTPGGTWSVAVPTIATVNPTTGVLTGGSVGTTVVTYTLGAGCFALRVVTVTAGPAPITGASIVCTGGGTVLTDVTPGGSWISGNTSIATVSIAGFVTGVAPGVVTISYAVGGCVVTKTLTVTSVPTMISGPFSMCVGSTVTYSDSVSGGSWSSSNPSVITINSSTGVATGLSVGVANITYANVCGNMVIPVTVNPGPAAIGGPGSVCTGSSIVLNDAIPGGTWSSSNPAVASVGITSGVVTGLSMGTSTITYKLPSGCMATRVITVNLGTPISGPSMVCSGSMVTYSADSASGTWSSSNLAAGTIISSTGVFIAGASGVTVITFTATSGCMSTMSVTVMPTPAAIGGPSSVCVGGTITLTDVASGGTWASSNTSVATVSFAGVVTGVAPGTAVISYILPTGCMVTRVVTVTPGPSAISGPTSVCTGSSISLFDATPGGTWSSSNTSRATVSSAGIVTGISTGTVTITYSIGGCIATKVITVTSGLPAITGSGIVCTGSSITLFDSVSGGVWFTGDTATAAVGSSTGVVTGLSFGLATITYYMGGCYATKTVTVLPTPAAIGGPSNVCVGSTITLTDATPGGVWSSSTPLHATVSAAGVVTGVSTGTTIITYTTPGGCFVTKTVTVTPGPAAIIGSATVCIGSTAIMSDATTGGTWSSSNPSIASINPTSGVVTGISAGSAVITYSVGGCMVTKTITVGGANPIMGSNHVCVGGTITLFDSTFGGMWLSGMPTIATIDSMTGVVTGVSSGVAVITYVSGGCFATMAVTVTPGPAAISGPSALCVGSTGTYTDATGGGSWSSTNTSVATINPSTGVLTAVGAGVTTIKYTLTSGCVASKTVTVTPAPFPISGPFGGCVGSTFTLTDSISGGVWSSSSTIIATVGATTGIVTGVHAGVAVITYSLGSCSVTKIVTISAAPAAISGPGSLCAGTTITLSDASAGGTWSSSNTFVAVVSTTGIVTGVHSGVATIYYTVGACSVSKTITVNAAPLPIMGSSTVCIGSPITLMDSITGGIWTSSSPSIAAVGSSSGIVTGLASGVATIYYTIGGCSVAKTVTVSAAPAAITGSSSVCVGTTITLSDATTGGTWSSSNTAIATVSTTGMVTGVSAGVVHITYTKGCYAVKTVTVNNAPGPIAGPSSVCAGSSITLTDPTPGGTWIGSNALVATVNTTSGVVTGVAPGFIVAYYTVGGCSVYRTVTVNAAPKPITGPSSLCTSASIALGDLTSGGIWISSNIVIATVGPTGIVHGVSAGLATISYTLPSTGCSATKGITVNPCGKIGGTVKTGAGRGTSSMMSVVGMLVELQNAETHEVVAQTYTDDNGAYTFYELGLGNYVVYPKENGYTTTPSVSIAITKTSLEADNINFIKNNGDQTIAPMATTEASTVGTTAGALSIYPNPSNGDLNIMWENQSTGTANVVITNIVGSEVYKGTLNVNAASGQAHIDLKNLKSGIYLINITSDNISYSSKLFIQQ